MYSFSINQVLLKNVCSPFPECRGISVIGTNEYTNKVFRFDPRKCKDQEPDRLQSGLSFSDTHG